MNQKWHIPRRRFLKGLGTAMALPMFEAMRPLHLLAGNGSAGGAGAATASGFPKRMAFVYVPNGANMADWTPSAVGTDYELPFILEPLKSFKQDLLVLSGLAQDKARAHGDGGGDHARASATFLTGCQARKTAGAEIKVGVSVDQVAAAKIGNQTRFPSLELGCDRGHQSGSCDTGYSCAYSFNISWKTESSPLPAEVDPRLVFERLFGNGVKSETGESQGIRKRYQKSILDFVLEDANQLRGNLGATDRHKLDEYLTAIREIEQRIEGAERFAATLPDYHQPKGVPQEFEKHVQLMADLMALAFQTDSTRIATFLVAHDGSNNIYKSIGVSKQHHELSHHQGDPEKKKKIARINQYHVTQFAYLLEKLRSVKEGEGTLLDNCMVVYGSGISDGNSHAHDDLPILLAGKGGGTIKTGRHVRYEHETPLNNLYLSMLGRVGLETEKLGDGTGRLVELA